MGAVAAGTVGGEIAMFGFAYYLNASDPIVFSAPRVVAKAIGLIWMTLAASSLGFLAGRKKARAGKKKA